MKPCSLSKTCSTYIIPSWFQIAYYIISCMFPAYEGKLFVLRRWCLGLGYKQHVPNTMYTYYWHLLGYNDQGKVNVPCIHLYIHSWLCMEDFWFSWATKKQVTLKHLSLRHNAQKAQCQTHRWILKLHSQTSKNNQHGFRHSVLLPIGWGSVSTSSSEL